MFESTRDALTLPVLAVVGAIMLYQGYQERRDNRALEDHGVTTEATIESVDWQTIDWRNRNYSASIHYETESGRSVRASVDLSDRLGKSLRNQSPRDMPPLEIRYLPEDTQVVVLSNHADSSDFLLGIGAACPLGSIAMAIYRRS